MSTSPLRRGATTGLGVALLTMLVACTGTGSTVDPTPATPEPSASPNASDDVDPTTWTPPEDGACYATDAAGGPDWAGGAVACTELHAYEVLATLPLPAELAVDDRELVVDAFSSDPVRVGYRAWASAACGDAMREWTGLGEARFGAVDANEAHAAPWQTGGVWFDASPAESWETTRAVVCAYRYFTDQGDNASVRSPFDGPLLAGSFESDAVYPSDLRVCEDADAAPVPCSGPHRSEYVLGFDASAVLGEAWVDAVDPDAVTDEQWAELDQVCAGVAELVLGGPGDPADAGLTLLADIRGDWAGSPEFPDQRPAQCMLRASDDSELVGSKVGVLG